MLYLATAFLCSLNRNYYIIEVYNDHFNLITPSFYGNKFAETETYFFEEIKSFEFEKGFYDWNAALLGTIIRMFIPAHFIGILFAYQYPYFSFTQKDDTKTEIKFLYNQDRLINSFEFIENKINHRHTVNNNHS